MLQFNYFIHSILNSKYRLLFTLTIYILIYLSLKNTSTAYCMTENPDVPEIAEAKEVYKPSHQVLAIKREIMTYAGGQAHFIEQIEEQTKIVEEQKNIINTLTEELKRSRTENFMLSHDLKYAKNKISDLQNENVGFSTVVRNMREELEYNEKIIAELQNLAEDKK